MADDDMDDWAAALAEEEADKAAADDGGMDDDIDMAAALAEQEAEGMMGGGGGGDMSLGDVLRADDQLEAVYDVYVDIVAVLGTSMMPMSQILKLGRGAVVELDRGVGDPIDVLSGDQLIAKGEVVVVDDKLAVEVRDIIRSTRSR